MCACVLVCELSIYNVHLSLSLLNYYKLPYDFEMIQTGAQNSSYLLACYYDKNREMFSFVVLLSQVSGVDEQIKRGHRFKS